MKIYIDDCCRRRIVNEHEFVVGSPTSVLETVKIWKGWSGKACVQIEDTIDNSLRTFASPEDVYKELNKPSKGKPWILFKYMTSDELIKTIWK